MAERVGKVVPEPVLEVVHEREEDRRGECGRDPDQSPEANEAKIDGGGDRRLLVGHQSLRMLSRILSP